MLSDTCDVLIVGGSLGGVAAALRASSLGATVVLLAEGEWLGGQLTSQGVCTPDENRWIEKGGGTASYRAFRRSVRDYYRTNYRLSDAAAEPLNPGLCWVSRISAEPRAAERLLSDILSKSPNLTVLRNTRVVEAERRIDRIAGIIARDSAGREARYAAEYVLDATELGDLLPLAGVDHALGAESRVETGEPDAPEIARPDWIQPITFPFALELRRGGEEHTIPQPPRYEEMKALQKYHVTDGAMRGMFGELSWWSYRRILAAENFDDPAIPCDVAMINTPSNDFRGGVIPSESSLLDESILKDARLASLGYVRWLQTECPREDDPTRRGYPELKLRADIFDSADGLAPCPYIRESRRIKALATVLEQDIVSRDGSGVVHQRGPRSRHFSDSCGIGHYWLDIHNGGTDEPERLLETQPFQIPLGALIPVKVRNVLAACRNIGVTHLTNGAYRLHPIEWNIGESAGALAAYCVSRRLTPHTVHEDPSLLLSFQDVLLESGIPLYWWSDLPSDHPSFIAAQRLGMNGIWADDSLAFRSEEPLEPRRAVELARHSGVTLKSPASRGEAAMAIDEAIRNARSA